MRACSIFSLVSVPVIRFRVQPLLIECFHKLILEFAGKIETYLEELSSPSPCCHKNDLTCSSYSFFFTYLYIYIYVNICNHENNIPSRSSPQGLCGNSCPWTHDALFIMCPSRSADTKPLYIYPHQHCNPLQCYQLISLTQFKFNLVVTNDVWRKHLLDIFSGTTVVLQGGWGDTTEGTAFFVLLSTTSTCDLWIDSSNCTRYPLGHRRKLNVHKRFNLRPTARGEDVKNSWFH